MADPPETRSSFTRVTMPNLVALLQIVWAYVGVPKFGDVWAPPPCDMVWLALYKYVFPHMCHLAKYGRSMGQTLRTLITETRRKKMIPRVPHFKVTRGHRNRQRDGPIGYL